MSKSGKDYGMSEDTYGSMATACMTAKHKYGLEPCACESLACSGCVTTLYGRCFSFALTVRPLGHTALISLRCSRLDELDESFLLLEDEPDNQDTWQEVISRMARVDNFRTNLGALSYAEVADILCKRGLLV
jgi:hypothetical protein